MDPSNADWLDRAIDWVARLLEAALIWTGEMLGKCVVVSAGFVLHHWVLFSAIGAVAFLRKPMAQRLTVNFVLTEHFARKRVEENRERKRTHKERAAQSREDAWLAHVSQREFEAYIERLRREMARHEEIYHVLCLKMYDGSDARMDLLRVEAEEHHEAINKIKNDISRLKSRRVQVRAMHLVMTVAHAPDYQAKSALSELNGIWTKIDWGFFVPPGMAEHDKDRLVTFLEIMASSVHLGEARAAYHQAVKFMEARGYGERRRAA